MRIAKINWKRILLTTAVCLAASALTAAMIQENLVFIWSPIIFSVIIPLTCYDKIKVSKYSAFLINPLINFLILFLSIPLLLLLAKIFAHELDVYAICLITAVAAYCSQRIFMHISGFTAGLMATIVLSLFIPLIPEVLLHSDIDKQIASGFTAPLMISWQTIVGFCISIGIHVELQQTVHTNQTHITWLINELKAAEKLITGNCQRFESPETFKAAILLSAQKLDAGDQAILHELYQWFAPSGCWDDATGQEGTETGNRIFEIINKAIDS